MRRGGEDKTNLQSLEAPRDFPASELRGCLQKAWFSSDRDLGRQSGNQRLDCESLPRRNVVIAASGKNGGKVQVIVGRADCRIGSTPGQVLVTHGVTGGVGLALYDPKRFIGGLLHYSLPDSSVDPKLALKNPYMFADTGIPLLLESMYAAGANKRMLVARAVGGASRLDPNDAVESSKLNFLALRKSLWKAGVLLSGKAAPEGNSCTLALEIGSGRLLLQEYGE
jgi:chemotaxis protein CheD